MMMLRRVLFSLAALILACAPALAYTKVQANGAAAFGPQVELDCTFSSPVTSGNFVDVSLVSANVGTDVFTITDNASTPNTYNVGPLGTDGSGSPGMVIGWLGNVQNGPTVIKVVNNTSRSNLAVVCEEWSGVNSASDPKDVAPATPVIQATPGTGTNGISSTGVTTVTNGDLLLGFTANRTNTTCPTTAGTTSVAYSLTSASTTFNNAVSCIQIEAGTQATAAAGTVATFTQGSANPAVTTMLAVKAAGGGAAVIPIPVITSQPFAHP